MVLVGPYGQSDEVNTLQVLRHAGDTDVDLLDTADAYGPESERAGPPSRPPPAARVDTVDLWYLH